MKKAFSVFIVFILITLQSSGIFAGAGLANISSSETALPSTKVSLAKLKSFSSIMVVVNSSLAEQMKRLVEVSGSVGSLADSRSKAPVKKEKAAPSAFAFAMASPAFSEIMRAVDNFSGDNIAQIYSNSQSSQGLLILALLLMCFCFIRTLMLRCILFLPRAGIEYSVKTIIIRVTKSLIDEHSMRDFSFPSGARYGY